MSAWWAGCPQLTARQRDVQAAHHTGFWRGARRGFLVGNLIALPPYVAWLVWWYSR